MPAIRIHQLKIKPNYFKDVVAEIKRFEVRYNDRNYKAGDILVLEEFDKKGYTGRYVNVEITYICDDPQFTKQDYVVLGIRLRLDRGAVIN